MKKSLWSVILFVIPFVCFAQEDFAKEVQQKLSQYYADNLPVRIALFFNQPEYAPGDTAWFKVAFVLESDHRPIAKRQIINIDVLSETGSNLIHQKMFVNDGYGFNQLIIPQSFSPGVYTFVAHGDWMKNFDQSLFGFHDLVVSAEKAMKKKAPADVKVYPEGGFLVGGVSNKVVVNGSPGAKVTITNSTNQTVSCLLNDKGWGVAHLFPLVTDTYRVVEGAKTSQLNTATDKNVAITLHVPQEKNSPIEIRLTHNAQSDPNETFYLLITASGDIYHASRIAFNSGQQAEVKVDPSQLRGGLMMATLFRGDRRVEAQRLFFVDDNNVNAVSIATERSVYAPREKVTLEINMNQTAGNPMPAMLGVTVFHNELFASNNTGSARKILLPGDADFNSNTNEWLITQQWKQFNWTDVLSGQKKVNKYKFKSNLHFTGHVIDGAKLAVGGVPVVSFFLPHDVRIYAEYLKKDGTFDFDLFFDFENKEDVYYTIEKTSVVLKDAKMVVEPEELVLPASGSQYMLSANLDRYWQFTNNRKALDAAYKHGSVDEMKSKQVNPHAFLEEEVFDADVNIDLSKYLIFPTMEETLREIIPSLQHRWKNGQHTVRARIIEPDAIPKGDPIYFIDGVLTGNTNYFMGLKPEDVSRIKIIRSQRKLSAFGAIARDGIVLVETKLVDNASRVPTSLNSFTSTGLNPQAAFKSPDVTDPKLSRTPLFRSTLYWNPSVPVGLDGKATLTFYTADNTGTFTIRVDGFASNGEPITEEKVIEVRFTKPDN